MGRLQEVVSLALSESSYLDNQMKELNILENHRNDLKLLYSERKRHPSYLEKHPELESS